MRYTGQYTLWSMFKDRYCKNFKRVLGCIMCNYITHVYANWTWREIVIPGLFLSLFKLVPAPYIQFCCTNDVTYHLTSFKIFLKALWLETKVIRVAIFKETYIQCLFTYDDCLTITWFLLDDFLSDDCLMTAWWYFDVSLMTVSITYVLAYLNFVIEF